MGSGISRAGSGSYNRAGPQQRRLPEIRRSISSILVCGASSSREIEDYPAELLVKSAEHGHKKKLKFPRKKSDLPVRDGGDPISIKTESVVSSARFVDVYENHAPEADTSHFEPGNRGNWLSESRELVPSHQFIDSSRGNGTASSSYRDQQPPYCVSENEASSMDAMNGINYNMNDDASQIGEEFNNSSSAYYNGLGEPLLDEVSVENNASEEVDFSNSEFGSSFVSDSPIDFNLLRDDTLQGVTSPGLGFLVSEREQNIQDGSLLHVDPMSISSNILPTNLAEISSGEASRTTRRLFWDAFSRRNSRRHADSRTFLFSSVDSDIMRSHGRRLLDFSGGLLNDEIVSDLSSQGSRTPSSNEQQLNSRSEIWERLQGNLDSTNYLTATCPRGIHNDDSCSCYSSSSAEEAGARTGISRMVMLAEALFEVLDQIHQQPMSLSLSMVSLPAPESVVDSFPVRTHQKSEKLESADDVSQCYICLAEYEEGDKIRVLPCRHEYHQSCVDQWLKEIHGVCPLCRGHVHEGLTDSSVSS